MIPDNEIAAMKERDRKAIARGELHPDAPITMDRHALLIEREELLKDKERLDWLQSDECVGLILVRAQVGKDLRKAIDVIAKGKK